MSTGRSLDEEIGEWYVMPEDRGKIVEVSYSQTPRGLYRRVTDYSTGEVEFYFADWDYDKVPEVDDDPFEPWNGSVGLSHAKDFRRLLTYNSKDELN